MREIKFRAWDKNKKIMIDDYYQDICKHYPAVKLGEYISKTVRAVGEYYETYMQYTGLKDKNGKEIYEDDVIEEDSGLYYQIIFENGCFGYFNNPTRLCENSIEEYDIKIIGNIYENPELLKETK